MKIFELVDLFQRRVNSLIFRVVLLGYSFVILFNHYNFFSWKVYATSVLVYLIAYLKTLKYSKLRLFNDYIYIFIILYGKDPNYPLNYLFLLLPLINSINFSGEKKSILLYLISIFSYIALIFYQHNEKIILNDLLLNPNLIPFLILALINSYTSLRIKIRNFRESLNDVVDGFYLKKELVRRPYKIYNEIINVIHEKVKSNLIENIYCFAIIKEREKLLLINGSSFVWNYEFNSENIIKRIRTKELLINENLKIEGKSKKYNLFLYFNVENQEYVYVFVTSKLIPIYYILIGFFRTLTPAFSKMTKILISEKKIQEIKNEELKRLSQSSQFVNRANKTMHFIRNRLGPFSNLLKMLDNEEKIEIKKIKEFKLLLNNEKDRTKVELCNIVERANDMLEKGNNPFVYTKIERISIERIYTILRRNFMNYFPELEINVNVVPDKIKRVIFINEEGFEIFLSDWLNNMKKYMKKKISCEFEVRNSDLVISFYNDYHNRNQEVEELIRDFKSNDRNEIMKRTTHGLFIMKSILEDMCIDYDILNLNDLNEIKFTLIFNVLKDENSNI